VIRTMPAELHAYHKGPLLAATHEIEGCRRVEEPSQTAQSAAAVSAAACNGASKNVRISCSAGRISLAVGA